MFNFIQKNRILFTGIISTIILLIIMAIGYSSESALFWITLYSPGLFFGFGICIGLSKKLKFLLSLILIILLAIEFYITTFLYADDSFTFMFEFRKNTLGGFGAIISFFTIGVLAKIKFKLIDYLIAFSFGTFCTVFMFLINSTISMYLTIALWQIGMYYIINLKTKTT